MITGIKIDTMKHHTELRHHKNHDSLVTNHVILRIRTKSTSSTATFQQTTQIWYTNEWSTELEFSEKWPSTTGTICPEETSHTKECISDLRLNDLIYVNTRSVLKNLKKKLN